MFYVHEEFPAHEKLEPLEGDPRAWAECLAVWLTVGCDCRHRLSDGRVSRVRLERITPLGKRVIAVAERLVELGLWDRDGTGYQFHDWEHVQETKDGVQERRLKWKEAKRAHRESKVEAKRASKSEGVVVSTQDSISESQADSARESPTNRRGEALSGSDSALGSDAPANSVLLAGPKPPVKLVPALDEDAQEDPGAPPTEKRKRISWAYGRQMRKKGIAFMSMGAPFALEAFKELSDFCEVQAEIEGHGDWDTVATTLLRAFFELPGLETDQWNLTKLQVRHRALYTDTADFEARKRQLG